MTRWLTLHRDDIPFVIFTVASIGLATIVAINILNFYRVLMSDFLKVVGDGAISDATRRRQVSEPVNNPKKEEIRMNGSMDTVITSAATENLIEKIRDVAYLREDNLRNEASNGFHLVSKDMNKIMASFFSNGVMEDFESVGENQEHPENVTRQQKQGSGEENGDSLLSGGCDGLSSTSKKDN
jgi:hypothetical protein